MDDVHFQCGYVFGIIARVENHLDEMRLAGIDAWWSSEAETPHIVDVADSTWIAVEVDNPSTAALVAEYLSLMSPGMLNLMLDMMKNHITGILALLDENPTLKDSLKVSPEVVKLATMMHEYTLRNELVDDVSGDWIRPKRKLGRDVWKDDE